ncbi:hypothetical protein [Anabaena sphaerica]|uniref:hypothetical protein n=1 Tax=Anabaena sphaerica TaxID=212446 RepID=UPI0018F049E0|nr:hypothetical protein [Anabaena sphaerica]
MSNSPFSDLTNVSETQLSKLDNHPQFNKWFLLTIAICILMVVSVNFVIDPYDIYKTPNFLGINHEKPGKQSNDRLFKAIDIIRIKPLTVFLGSSRTKQGLNPDHPGLSNAESIYNLALDGAVSYEILRYLQHTLKNQPNLKEVIFGIDFFMFNKFLGNQPGFDENRLEKNYLFPSDIMNSLFSLDTLEVSRKTILASLQQENYDKYYGENGFMPNSKYRDGKAKIWFTKSINIYFQFNYKYKFNDKYFEDFQKIVKICREKNIKLKVFISPSHAIDLESIRVTGEWQTFENWKRKILKVTPVWDFSGYNSITTEPLQDVMENYADSSHYTKPVGDLILNRILGYKEKEVPADFGVLITPENIESHLAKIRADREEWVKNRKSELELVQNLENKFGETQQQKDK